MRKWEKEIITTEQEIVVLMPAERVNVTFVAFFNWTLFTCSSPINTELPCIRKQIYTFHEKQSCLS